MRPPSLHTYLLYSKEKPVDPCNVEAIERISPLHTVKALVDCSGSRAAINNSEDRRRPSINALGK